MSSITQNRAASPHTQAFQPGKEHKMDPQPSYIRDGYRGADKLNGKVALISGGDSGIGRAVAVHFAREGANLAIIYLNETEDAEKTKALVDNEGQHCLLIKGDVREEGFCHHAVEQVVKDFGQLDILVNNAAQQFPKSDFSAIKSEDFRKTFEVNMFGYFYLAQAALKHLPDHGRIINTTSVTAYRGSGGLVDYSSTKGAIVAFTRSLAKNLAHRNILVNGVAPGPIWTPLIPATFGKDKVSDFGKEVPLKRPGQPSELAPLYVLLASKDSSYITGQVFHVNGGDIVGG